MKKEIKKIEYVSPDYLTILIRKNGGTAWTEIENDKVLVFTYQTKTWINKILKKENMISL